MSIEVLIGVLYFSLMVVFPVLSAPPLSWDDC